MSVTQSLETAAQEYSVRITTNGQESLTALETAERRQVMQKLDRICTCPYRSPWEWDFKRMDGICERRLTLADGLRAFVDIDRRRAVIVVHRVTRRENLY